MNNDSLDRILSHEENIVPSSGFVSSVVDAVNQEAATPPPIRFPWKPAVPGLVACLALAAILFTRFAAGVSYSSERMSGLVSSDRILPFLKQMFHGAGTGASAGWIVAALLLSFIALQLSMRIVRGRN